MTSFFKAIVAVSCTFAIGACATTNSSFDSSIPRHEKLSREVAMQAYNEGDYHLAEGLLQQLAEAPILDPQAPCYLGAIHYRQHNYKAALKRFTECSQHFPERSEAWFNAAAAHLRLATELLLTGRSYQGDSFRRQTSHSDYQSLLDALLSMQRVHTSEVD